MMPTAAGISDWIREQFPPRFAESWDAVGDVCGRPDSQVTGVLVCVDVTPAVVQQAIDSKSNFILAHHPLLLGGVTSVAPSDYKGELLHTLIENGIALHVAHTNADSARPGVSDALATALGVVDLVPLTSAPGQELDKVVVFVPPDQAQALLTAMSEAGAGHIGDYDRCAFLGEGIGTFRPLQGARPHIGEVGRVEDVTEVRLEMVLPRRSRDAVVAALRSAHPYEEPAFDMIELAQQSPGAGIGRVGELPQSMSLSSFVESVAQALPKTAAGVKATGDPDALIKRVAVCGGSGESLLRDVAAAGADVYVTSDLKHHRVSEHVEDGGCALIDVAHFASEFPWCEQVAASLEHELISRGDTVPVTVSRVVTDPWTRHVRSS